MKRNVASRLVLAAVLCSTVCAGAVSADEPDPAWNQRVYVDVKDLPIPAAMEQLFRGMGASYTLSSSGEWPKVTVALHNVSLGSALRHMMMAVNLPYCVDGSVAVIAKDRSGIPARSVRLKIDAVISFESGSKKPVMLQMSQVSTAADGSPMQITNWSAAPASEKRSDGPPSTIQLAAQLLPLIGQEGGDGEARSVVSLTGNCNLSLSIPYTESVSTVVGENVIEQKVARFTNVAKDFNIGAALQLDVPSIIAEASETTQAGKMTCTITVTPTVSKGAAVVGTGRAPAFPSSDGHGRFGGRRENGGLTVLPPPVPTVSADLSQN